MGLTEHTVSLLASWGASAILPAVVTAVIAYFCGCFNGAVIVSKYILRDDVRGHGSGNAGLTNFYRTFGLEGTPVRMTIRQKGDKEG